jgi:selenocysteine lyase/cysteine desulfurase
MFLRVALPGVVRVSLGIENSAEDVDALIQALRGGLLENHRSISRGSRLVNRSRP